MVMVPEKKTLMDCTGYLSLWTDATRPTWRISLEVLRTCWSTAGTGSGGGRWREACQPSSGTVGPAGYVQWLPSADSVFCGVFDGQATNGVCMCLHWPVMLSHTHSPPCSRRRASLRSLQSAVEDPDCCLCCVKSNHCTWLQAKARRLCAAVKGALKNMLKFLRCVCVCVHACLCVYRCVCGGGCTYMREYLSCFLVHITHLVLM